MDLKIGENTKVKFREKMELLLWKIKQSEKLMVTEKISLYC